MPGRTAIATYTFVPPDLIMVNTEDITERKQTEEALREGEYRFRELFDNAPVGYHEFNKEGIITRVNRTELDMVGYTLEEVIGQPVWKFIMEEDVSHQTVLAKLAGDLPLSKGFERTYRRKDGSTFPVLIEDRLLENEKGQVVGIRSTIQDITERKRMEEQFHIMSIADELTGLYNRRGFFTISQQQLKVAERTKKDILLFFADLDNMKRINDTLGHQAGDRVLVEIAAILKEIFRESDIIGRIGGDEFAILAIDTADESGEVLMERLHKSLEANNRLEAKNYTLSLCIGIARYDHTKPSSLDELMAQADTLMYEEKRKKQIKEIKGDGSL
jgi:diguanylate cyclase (GGDEF)-like protein/PAS domain S-box-containing protein